MIGAFQSGVMGSVVLDSDANAYLTAVETADGQVLEPGVRSVINDFVVGCKADGIWSAIKASCILSGARTLAGALVPLVGAAPTNIDFVGNDYNRKTGLNGDGSTKVLITGLAYNAITTDNEHLSVYASAALVGNAIGGGTAAKCYSRIGVINTNRYSEIQNLTSITGQGASVTGFIGASRSSSTEVIFRQGNSTITKTSNSVSREDTNTYYGVFCANYSDFARVAPLNSRLAFFSIGDAIDLAKLDTRVSALITAFGSAIA